MSTRQELTNKRSLMFSSWIRKKLPDSSTGLLVSDLDFILCNYKARILMLIEIKTRNAKLRKWQRMLFDNLDRWIKKGIDKDWLYYGYHVITFENTWFNDGICLFDGKQISETELISKLSL